MENRLRSLRAKRIETFIVRNLFGDAEHTEWVTDPESKRTFRITCRPGSGYLVVEMMPDGSYTREIAKGWDAHVVDDQTVRDLAASGRPSELNNYLASARIPDEGLIRIAQLQRPGHELVWYGTAADAAEAIAQALDGDQWYDAFENSTDTPSANAISMTEGGASE